VVLVPAQIRTLRLKSTNPAMPRQKDLAREAELHQSRISMFETPGAANITLETIAKIAAGLKVGVIVKFVPFHEMLRWENSFRADSFDVRPRLAEDQEFLNPTEPIAVRITAGAGLQSPTPRPEEYGSFDNVTVSGMRQMPEPPPVSQEGLSQENGKIIMISDRGIHAEFPAPNRLSSDMANLPLLSIPPATAGIGIPFHSQERATR
jgi:transcriptional regulator with XRE-family HTH domain